MTDSDEVFQRAATLGHYERLKDLSDPKWRAVSGFSFGEKYRMATITAAIGVVQMKHWRKRPGHPPRQCPPSWAAPSPRSTASLRPPTTPTTSPLAIPLGPRHVPP